MPSTVPPFQVCSGEDFGKDFTAETVLQLLLAVGKVGAPGRETAYEGDIYLA